MALFSRRNIGGTTRKGPKGDRRGAEGLKLYLPKFFSFPHYLGLSQDAFQGRPKRTEGGPKGDRRGTEGMHSAGVWHIWWACLVS